MLKNKDFERELLSLAFQTNERLTPHLVAYRLEIPFAEAKEHLDRSTIEGLLTLEFDDKGNTWYEMPGVERPKTNIVPKNVSPLPVMVPRKVATPPRAGINWFSMAAWVFGGFLLFGFIKTFFFPLLFLLIFFGIFKSISRKRQGRKRANPHMIYVVREQAKQHRFFRNRF